MEADETKASQDSENTPVQRFLARHVPNQLANPRKLCYRHRPDLARLRGPDEHNFTDVQKVQLSELVFSNINCIRILTFLLFIPFLLSKWISYGVPTRLR